MPLIKSEAGENDLPYPKAIYFIFAFEIGERMCNFGIAVIKTLYLENELDYSENEATALFHALGTFGAVIPIFGAAVADSWFGRYRTIITFAFPYCIGGIFLFLGTISPDEVLKRCLSLLGFILMPIGGGFVTACVIVFGGEQFDRNKQAKQLSRYFSIFYLIVNVAAMIIMYLTPVLATLECFGEDSCYPMAIGVPVTLLCIGCVIFFMGTPFYVIKKPERNAIVEVVQCTFYALKKKLGRSSEKKDHFLDYAEDKYDPELIEGIKGIGAFITLAIPMPLFWSLYNQQNSTWVAQASSMRGDIGNFEILPAHMQMINPVLILVLVPMFEGIIYPMLHKFNILSRPLQKMGTGLFLSVISYLATSYVQWRIQNDDCEVHMFWQLPQIIIMAVAEVLFSLTLMSFAFAEASEIMKSVLTAIYQLTAAFGNLFVAIISNVNIFDDDLAQQYLFYAVLMFCDFLVFLIFAVRYRYRAYQDSKEV